MLSKRTQRKSGRVRLFRRGAHTVEFALVAPIVFGLFLGAIEMARLNFVRHTVANAAYEGARAAIVPNATTDDAVSRAQKLLNDMGCGVDARITANVDPTSAEVIIAVPIDRNSWGLGRFSRGMIISRTCKLTRELQQ